MPPEALSADGQEARLGYVVGANGAEVVILWGERRRLERVPADEVTDRQICSREHDPMSTLPELFMGEPSGADYSPCPQ